MKMLQDYHKIRSRTEQLCEPLAVEDYVVQAMPDVSPPKWHLAHTAWFFETFLLVPHFPQYQAFHPLYAHLFNSYYNAVGTFFDRPHRGLLSRPTVEEIYRYRQYVDKAMEEFMAGLDAELDSAILAKIELGLNHEQQHQELLLTDLKYNFSINPLKPVYIPRKPNLPAKLGPLSWLEYPGGLHDIGHAGEGFSYDNESPRHSVYLMDYRLASRLVSNGEYLEFIAAGGYKRPEFWLSEGWKTAQEQKWQAPLYWECHDGAWASMTLAGLRKLDEYEPVCHVSFYEADAYARWRGKRLPLEAEWECAAGGKPVAGNFLESAQFHPVPAAAGAAQWFGDVWEWTESPYRPYPGFRAPKGALGEYNGKFMCNQMVLRGGSCVSTQNHIRATYRNFFYPPDRWQFTGIRLADDVAS